MFSQIKFIANVRLGSKYTSVSSFIVRLCSDQQGTIACGNNEIIKISFVFWGRRTSGVCKDWLDYRRCSSKKAFGVVKDKCNFKQQCHIEASKSELGNPGCWYLTSVYLEVSYTCFSKYYLRKRLTAVLLEDRLLFFFE